MCVAGRPQGAMRLRDSRSTPHIPGSNLARASLSQPPPLRPPWPDGGERVPVGAGAVEMSWAAVSTRCLSTVCAEERPAVSSVLAQRAAKNGPPGAEAYQKRSPPRGPFCGRPSPRPRRWHTRKRVAAILFAAGGTSSSAARARVHLARGQAPENSVCDVVVVCCLCGVCVLFGCCVLSTAWPPPTPPPTGSRCRRWRRRRRSRPSSSPGP